VCVCVCARARSRSRIERAVLERQKGRILWLPGCDKMCVLCVVCVCVCLCVERAVLERQKGRISRLPGCDKRRLPYSSVSSVEDDAPLPTILMALVSTSPTHLTTRASSPSTCRPPWSSTRDFAPGVTLRAAASVSKSPGTVTSSLRARHLVLLSAEEDAVLLGASSSHDST
jgi:hypothetical protein